MPIMSKTRAERGISFGEKRGLFPYSLRRATIKIRDTDRFVAVIARDLIARWFPDGFRIVLALPRVHGLVRAPTPTAKTTRKQIAAARPAKHAALEGSEGGQESHSGATSRSADTIFEWNQGLRVTTHEVAEPEVRIHLPPAGSPLRTCPTRLRRGSRDLAIGQGLRIPRLPSDCRRSDEHDVATSGLCTEANEAPVRGGSRQGQPVSLAV